jgi:hypothetical protein
MADPKLKLGNDIWATKQKSLLAYNDEGGNFKSLPFQVDRISGGTYVGRNGLIQSAASNEPRVDFSSNTKGGLLLEPQRTNLCLYSKTLSSWSVLNGASLQTITDNDAIAPDGTQTASTITFSSNGSSLLRHFSNTSYTSAKHSCSFWLKKINGNGNVFFGLTDTETEFTPTDEWVRYEANNITPTNFGVNLFLDLNFVCSAGDKIAVWGMQFEAGTYSTSTIPTSGAAVTRVQDYVAKGGNEYIFNDSEGVLYAEIQALANDQTYRFISISDNSTSSNRVVIAYNTISNQIRCDLIVGGSTQSSFTTNSYDITQKNKVAIQYKLNEVKAFVNGLQIGTTDTFANVFPSGTLNQINFDNGNLGSTFYFEGFLNDLQYFDEALSDSELATLTTI